MASAVPAELSQAKYHLPINGSHNPTPVKQPSQRAQDTITQVPRSPSVSQKPLPVHNSQKDSESIVHDSLEYRPPAPARPPIPVLDFLGQSGSIENQQLAGASYDKEVIEPNPSAQSPVIARSSLEVPLREHSSPEDHVIEEDSIHLPPHKHFIFEKDASPEDSDKARLPTSSQNHTVTANQNQAHNSVCLSRDGEDDEDEEIRDCITVRPQPTAPPAHSENSKAPKTPTVLPSSSREVEEDQNVTPLERLASVHLDVAVTTGVSSPSMPPKGSTTTTQSRKSASTASKKSSKPAQPLPDIVNQGETSAVAILRQRKAGETSQSNTTKQTSNPLTEAVSRTRTSQKIPARSIQAPTSRSSIKTTTKPPQQRQTQSQSVPTRQSSHKTKAPVERGEFDLPPDPDVEPSVELQREKRGQAKATETAAPSKKGRKSQSTKQTAKVSNTDDDDDDDDEDYNAPKSQKARGAATTRASTRAQTKKLTKDDGLNVPTPALGEAKPRRRTEKETQLMMEALTSPERATPPVATKPKINTEAPALQTYSSSTYKPMPEQGTTQRNPVKINDDGSNDDDEHAMNEDYDASFDQIDTELMSQKPQKSQEELKTPLIADQASKSRSADAHTSPVRQSPARLSTGHSNLDLLAQERAQRKPNFVSFNDAGPRNQGTRHMPKRSIPDMSRLPFAEASSPDLDQSNLEEPPVNYDTGLDMPTKKTSKLEVATHVDAASPTYKPLGDVVRSNPELPAGPLCKTASTVDVSKVKGKRSKGPELPTRAIAIDDTQTTTRLTRDTAKDTSLIVNHAAVERGIQAGLPETLVEDHSREISRKSEVVRERTVATDSLAPLGKPQVSLTSENSNDPALVGSKRREPISQILALPTPIDTQAPPRIRPRPIHRPTEMEAGESQKPPAQQTLKTTVELHSEAKETRALENDRKRPHTEMIGELAKRPRTDTHISRTQVARSPATKDPVSRRLSQVADNGSPIPYGIEKPQETVQSPRTRDERILAISIPPPFLAHQPLDDPFSQVKRFIHKEALRSESPLDELEVLQQGLPAQMSPAVTHAGFDEDTQVTVEDTQIFEPQQQLPKETLSEPQQNPLQRAHVTQTMLGLMETLRSEVVPQQDAQGADGDDVKDTEVDEVRDEDDPDKTLVNEESVDGDDGDSNDSESSSDSDDDDDKPKSGISMWRDALESHQGNVYDQLVRIAHRLTEHLKDHETAIKDISTDYKQAGKKLIERLETRNEARLEQYCVKRSKMQGGLVLGYQKVSGSMAKDKKDIKTSRERQNTMLQRQVDAEGRLEQMLETYHL